MAVAMASVSLMAVPAKPGKIMVPQADGTMMEVYQHGDEYMHYMTNAQGQRVELMTNGEWKVLPDLTESEMENMRQNGLNRMPQINKACGLDRNIAPHGLCVLVSYTDYAFETPREEMDSMLNAVHYARYKDNDTIRPYAEGSARQYFIDQSWGDYQPHFEVVGPYTLSHNRNYYGQNGGLHAFEMISEGCRMAVENGVDLGDYDNDNDGVVDFVFVIYAQYGSADSPYQNAVWPHSSDMKSRGIKIGDYTLGTYACANEINYKDGNREHETHTGIGTFCHEFSHVLGLPDLYSTDKATTHKTMGKWDIMDQGPYNNDGNTPPAYSGYERWFMGWMTPTILKESGKIEMTDINESHLAYLVSKDGQHNLDGLKPDPAEFYILEVRGRSGWDKFIPGSGLMVTRVRWSKTKWYTNTVNNKEYEQGVDLQEADGLTPQYPNDGYQGKAGDLYPGSAKVDNTSMFGKYYLNNIKLWGSGKLTFDFKAAGVGLECVLSEGERIIEIYDVLGNKLPNQNLESLATGMYVLRTNQGTKKVMLP